MNDTTFAYDFSSGRTPTTTLLEGNTVQVMPFREPSVEGFKASATRLRYSRPSAVYKWAYDVAFVTTLKIPPLLPKGSKLALSFDLNSDPDMKSGIILDNNYPDFDWRLALVHEGKDMVIHLPPPVPDHLPYESQGYVYEQNLQYATRRVVSRAEVDLGSGLGPTAKLWYSCTTDYYSKWIFASVAAFIGYAKTTNEPEDPLQFAQHNLYD